MNEEYSFHKPRYVGFSKSRWSLMITVVEEDGTERRYVASADSYYAQGDQLWFSTMEEYNNFDG